MPRNAAGTYSLPNPAVAAGTPILASWANSTLNDLATALTDSLDRTGDGAMQAPLRLTDGTAADPALTFDADRDNGLYRIGANSWGLASAGTLRITIGAAGNITIAVPGSGAHSIAGVAGSSAGLLLSGAADTRFRIENSSDSNRGGYFADTGTAFRIGTNSGVRGFEFAPDSVVAMTINATRNVTINAPSSGVALSVNGVAGGAAFVATAGTATVAAQFISPSGNDASISYFATGTREWRTIIRSVGGSFTIRDESAGADRLLVSNAGNVTINAPSSGAAITVNGLSGANVLLAASSGAASTFNFGYNIGLASNRWNLNTNSTDGLSVGCAGSASLDFYSGGSQRIVLNATGNVTINSPSSGTSLLIGGSGTSNPLVVSAGAGANDVAAISLLVSGVRDYSIRQVRSAGNFVIRDESAAADRIVLNSLGNVTINAPSSGIPLTVNGNTALTNAGGVAITVTNSGASIVGYYGVDGSAPYIGSQTNHAFNIYSNNVLRITVGAAGNISLAAPVSGATLTVVGNAGLNSTFTAAGQCYSQWINSADSVTLEVGSNPTSAVFGTPTNHPITFYTNNTNRFVLEAGGALTVISPSSGIHTIGGPINALGVALVAVKPSTTSRTTATPSNDPHLVIAIPAAGTYAVEAFIRLAPDGPGGAGGFLWGLNFSGTFTALSSYISSNGMINASAQIETSAQIGSSAASGIWFRTTILNGDWLVIRGTLTATTAGNLGLQWAQNSAPAGTLTMSAGGYIKATKLA